MLKREGIVDSEEEGTRHFMVNVIEPQFNLHSEDANVSLQTLDIQYECTVKAFQSYLLHNIEVPLMLCIFYF